MVHTQPPAGSFHSLNAAVRTLADRIGRENPMPDGLCYEILTDASHASAGKFQDLMERYFGKEEADPPEVLASHMAASRNPDVFSHAFYGLLTDADGSAVGAINFDVCPLSGSAEIAAGMISIGYIVITEAFRHQRLTLPIYADMLRRAADDADKRGMRLALLGGETVWRSEGHFNRALGMCRIYGKLADGSFKEFPYVQPPLQFDSRGEIAQGAGAVAEHYMMQIVGSEKKVIGVDTIMGAVISTYRAYAGYLEKTGNDERDVRRDVVLRSLIDGMEESLRAKSEWMLLSRDEREVLQGKGVVFHEHTSADRANDAGGAFTG